MADKVTLHNRATNLRINMTDAERVLWYHLRAKRFMNLKFRRQAIVNNYIVDFVCYSKKIIIEIDGGQHLTQCKYDNKRTRLLNAEGFSVIRFWNHEVLENIDAVLDALYCFCKCD